MTSHRLITKSLTIGLATTALGAPFAAAGPPADIHLTAQERQVLASRGQGAPLGQQIPGAQVKAPVSTNDGGFDWGSAAIGAGAAGGLSLIVGIGVLGLADNRRVRVAR
jgi:hypothetical protein